MKKLIYLLLFSLIFLACNSNKKQNSSNKISKQGTISIQGLKTSFEAKDEIEFLNQFPKSFDHFNTYFGWDAVNDSPQELYEASNDYISYWFELLEKEKYKNHESNIIAICKDGHWEADAVSYFQYRTIKYFKEKQSYSLINNLSDAEAKSVLFFLFDSPHPKFDKDFASHLSAAKKTVLDDLFKTGFFDNNENPDPIDDETLVNTHSISDYENVEHYFIEDIDINMDGVADKVVSAGP